MMDNFKFNCSKTFFLVFSFFAFFTSNLVYADSATVGANGVVNVTPVIKHSVPVMATPTIAVGTNYNSLPPCPTTPTVCPTVAAGPWPSTCPSACVVSRSPVNPAQVTSTNFSYVDPAVQITMPKCPTGYTVVDVFNMQPEVGISTAGYTGTAQMVGTANDYNTMSALSYFKCTSSGGGELDQCGSASYSTGQVVSPSSQFSSTNVAYITNVYSGGCGCAGSCSSSCNCNIADTPRKWYVDWTLKECTLTVPAGGEYLTGNNVPVSTVCGYQLAPTIQWENN